MNNTKFSFAARLRSFKYAFNGLRILFQQEHNARIHAFATCCVVIAATILKCSLSEWIALIFAIGFVIACEAINSSIERLCDHICNGEKHENIGIVKDLASAGVLIAAITAAIIGLLIFIPKIFA